jgi:DNA-binding transcriptional ArsR family regulator
VDIGQPGVSRQLSILQDARFVRVRADGRRRLYALRPQPFRELDGWMRRYRDLWEARLDRLRAEIDRRRKERARDKGATRMRTTRQRSWQYAWRRNT